MSEYMKDQISKSKKKLHEFSKTDYGKVILGLIALGILDTFFLKFPVTASVMIFIFIFRPSLIKYLIKRVLDRP